MKRTVEKDLLLWKNAEKRKPHPKFAIRFSSRNLRQDGDFVNIPHYLAAKYQSCL